VSRLATWNSAIQQIGNLRWERGEFDLPAWLEQRPDEAIAFPAPVWQQIVFGLFAWSPERAAKRARSLLVVGGIPVVAFGRPHALRAAQLEAELKTQQLGFADFQIAATALVDGAELFTFNRKHFQRLPGLKLAGV
jgi:predicted nucleic acid-binding protein